ncbi:DUF4329 domain-containing protein [Luteimonas sp. Y-2-2-4F]|nr:DUF4329 domain-containing protein [Luteimonas sp. Y-2-2-4F]MCD9033216.1 DUF4329 domain-containing protein [Luteimonas sp. Y-2-2-4F]
MTVSAVSPSAVDGARAAEAAQPARGEARYEQLVDRFVAPAATQEQRDQAYDLVAGVEADGQVTDEALAQQGAQAIADNRTIPVQVAQVAPLVAPGTALGPFESADAAAIEMMNYSNPLSIEANLENGGLVFSNADGQFFVSTPMQGTLAGFDPSQVPQPDGMTLEACYHGHADYSKADGTRTDKAGDEFNSDHFSEQDKRVADGGYWGPVIYVSTPSGDFRKYDSATREDTVIQQGTRDQAAEPAPSRPPGIMIPV